MFTSESAAAPRSRPGLRLRRRLVVVGLCGWLGSVGLSAGQSIEPPRKSRIESICPDEFESLSRLLGTTKMLLLGEIHGSKEVPAYTLQTICAALPLSNPIVLGLEIWAAEQTRIDVYTHSRGLDDDRRRLLAGGFWQRPNQDGRASVAMLDLIDGVRQLVAIGAQVSVFCFDAEDHQPMDLRDYRMGTRLLEHRKTHADSRFIILTGNVHARTRVGMPSNVDLRPMGWHLAGAEETLISLNVRYTDGEFWVCNPDCGVQHLDGSGHPDRRGFKRFESRSREGYDGVFDIGIPTASPPAVGASQ